MFDKNNNLIAIVHKDSDFRDGKTFYTDNNKDFQFGTFKLEQGEIIENHIHNLQKREINNTSEAIVVIKGSLKIMLFDNEKNFIDSVIINTNDAILLFEGGHGIEVIEGSKFIEFKQGPYIEDMDKKHF